MYKFIFLTLIYILFAMFGASAENVSPFDTPDPIRVKEREHSILFYQGNYIPSSVTVFEGEDLILHFANFSYGPQCLWSKKLDFFVSSYQGKVTSSSLKKMKSGVYEFSCPSEGEANKTFTVRVLKNLDYESKKEKVAGNRLPSSVSHYEDQWMPRDENNDYFKDTKRSNSNNVGSKYSDYPDDDYENYFQGAN